MRRFDRVSLLTIAIGVLSTQAAVSQRQPRKADSSQVVFVCEHGTVKSVVALEHFNRLARARGLAVRAVSRGTNPDTAIPPAVRRGLESDGFDVAAFQPRRLTPADLQSARLVVTLDADVGGVGGRDVPVLHWDGLPSVSTSYSNGRSAIVARVERLVDSLARTDLKRRKR